MLHKQSRRIFALILGSASLASLACGALSGLSQVADQAEAISTQVEAISTQAEAMSTQAVDVATQVAEGEIALPEEIPAGVPGADLDACTLITDAEVEAVIGGPIRETVSGPGTCLRYGENSRDVSLSIIPTGSEAAAQAMFAAARTEAQEQGEIQDVPGSWAEGFWELETSAGVFFIRQGGYVIFLSTDNPDVYPARWTSLSSLPRWWWNACPDWGGLRPGSLIHSL
jgi:hypothetical protein